MRRYSRSYGRDDALGLVLRRPVRYFDGICLAQLPCSFLHFNLLRWPRLLPVRQRRTTSIRVPQCGATRPSKPLKHIVTSSLAPDTDLALETSMFPVLAGSSQAF